MKKAMKDIKVNFKVSEDSLHCTLCGNPVGYRVGNKYILSSESEGDESKGICHTCVVEHCVETSCKKCSWYKRGKCPHRELKALYSEDY